MNPAPLQDIARLRVREDESACLAAHDREWPAFWQQLHKRLAQDGYRPTTLRLYRQVLRNLRTFLRDRHGVRRPGGLTLDTAEDFLAALGEQNVSWSWMATAIAVLRNAFDRLCRRNVTARMVTPRRNWPLPETLSEREVRRLFDVLPNPRDRLLVALLAGCGLRVSEACRIRWADFSRECATLRIEDPSGLRSRTVSVPRGLIPTFQGLAALSRPSDPMISGRRLGPDGPLPLTPRQAERVIQSAGRRSGVLKRVTPMSLRHTYALRRLMAGDNVRAIQDALGHRSLETTLRYQACLPAPVVSPADPFHPQRLLTQATDLLDRVSAALLPTPPVPQARPHTTPLAIPSAPSVVSVPSIPLTFVAAAAAFAPPAFPQGP